MSNKYASLRMKITIMAMLVAVLMTAPLKSGSGGPPGQPILRINTEMHTAKINRIDVDRSESTLITASKDKTVRVWDINTGRLKTTLRVPIDLGNDGMLYAAAISPDGAVVAAGGWTGYKSQGGYSIYLLDARTGRMRRRISGLPNVIFHLTFSPDGRYLAATLGSGGLRVYDTRNWRLAAKDTGYEDNSYWADFDNTGQLVTACWDGYVRLYDKDFKLIKKKKTRGGDRPFSCAFSPDGKKVAVGFADTTKVNVLSGKKLDFMYAPDTQGVDNGTLGSVAWSADGGYLYAGGVYHSILRWSNGGRGPARPGSRKSLPGTSNTIQHILSLSDGRVIHGGSGPAWGVLSTSGERSLFKQPAIADYRNNWDGFMVSADGSEVRFGYENRGKSPALFSVKNRRLDISPTDRTTDRNVYRPKVVAKSGKFKVTGWEDTRAPKIDGRDLELKKYETSRSLAISPDENSFVLGTEWNVYCFDKKGKRLWKTPTLGVAWGVNVSGDGRLAVAAFGDGTIRWYRMTDGKEILAFFPHNDKKRWVMWTPSGYFACSPGGEELIGWHLNHGRDKKPDFFPASQFYEEFYRPEIFSRVIAGEKIEAKKDIRKGFALPPDVVITSPKEGATLNQQVIEVVVQAVDKGGGVTDIRLYHNDKLVGRDERGIGGVRQSGKVVTRTFKVTLVEGENILTATAQSSDKTESAPYKVVVRSAIKAGKPNLHIVAVGVNKYKNPRYKLRYSVADAQAMVDFFKAQEGKIYARVYKKTIFDEQATRDNILNALIIPATPDDVVVIYLAGHGLSIDGKYHFLPYNIPDVDDVTVKKMGVRQDEFIKALEAVNARKVLMLLDTCQSGSLVVGMRGMDEERAVKLLSRTAGVHVLAASKGSQAAAEMEKLGHGLFTHALLAGLKGKADGNRDGMVRISELLGFVCSEVTYLAEQIGKEQYPTMNMRGDDFPVAVSQ